MDNLEKFEIPTLEVTQVTNLLGSGSSTVCGCPNDCTKMAEREGEVDKD